MPPGGFGTRPYGISAERGIPAGQAVLLRQGGTNRLTFFAKLSFKKAGGQEQNRCLPMTVIRGRDQIQAEVAVTGLK